MLVPRPMGTSVDALGDDFRFGPSRLGRRTPYRMSVRPNPTAVSTGRLTSRRSASRQKRGGPGRQPPASRPAPASYTRSILAGAGGDLAVGAPSVSTVSSGASLDTLNSIL